MIPVSNAIREAIRNAVVHRDYSLTGKDIKVAVYDDMVRKRVVVLDPSGQCSFILPVHRKS